ncbi:hypothetical protein ZIOFF_049161 [Zingiber officinale]|uniref:ROTUNDIFOLIA like 8 n=1 Tax=Zingiber officinale TaxID=94328 RepID=A0A8J5G154_ZINOF|nr:hypothetical protein ZIOFF_049161 [Zingiber officinale]
MLKGSKKHNVVDSKVIKEKKNDTSNSLLPSSSLALFIAYMEICTDEKWKLSKKDQSRSKRERPPPAAEPALLRRSASTMEARVAAPPPTPRSFSRRCTGMVKEQRAKFYIMRRCVSMLMCWRERPD